VSFFDALAAEAQASYTPFVLLAGVVAFVLTKTASIDKPRFKVVVFFLGAHVLGLALTAGLAGVGSPLADTLRTPTWIFGAVSCVGATAALLFSVLLPRLHLPAPLIVQDVLVGMAMVAASLGVLSHAGVHLSGLIATSAVFTAILGLSLQDVIGNIAGGLALQVDNSIEEGDWIRVGDVTGRVVEIRWRHTAVETRNWETVLIPNTVMTKSNVFILGKRQGQPRLWRRWVYFNVDWRYQPGDVISVVQTAVRAAQLPNVAHEPPPNVVLIDMTETFGRYAVRYWLTDPGPDDPTDSEVRACVYFALQRADMPLAMPAQAVFLTQETSDRKAVKTARQLERRRDLLARLDLFAPLSDEERAELAKHMKYSPFARGEVMTRQGAEAHWLYLVEDGEAAVRVSDGTVEREVARLKGPTFFGEMSLLTGAPRSATVIAQGEVECFRLDKSAVQRILEARPELAKALAEVLAKRQVELQAAREGLDAEAARARAKHDAGDLLDRIRSFFALD
jgi:small-conductance mechanosensitive channel/CRP-like cAMP-binding protein